MYIEDRDVRTMQRDAMQCNATQHDYVCSDATGHARASRRLRIREYALTVQLSRQGLNTTGLCRIVREQERGVSRREQRG